MRSRGTRALVRRPQFARALLRAMAMGDEDTALKTAVVQLRVTRLLSASIRGEAPDIQAPLDRSSGDAHDGHA